MNPDHPRTQGTGQGASQGFRPSGRQIGGGIIAVVLIVFIASNTDDATIDFVFTKVTLSLAGTALLGVLVGVGIGTRRTKRKYRTP
jgi:uncharacterized integral membrane protein